jgi:PQQ-dependent dehydrogenase (methanol/ethanol family)
MSATRLAPLSIGLLALAACTSTSPGASSSSGAARIVAADAEPGSWLTHGRTYDEQRYSPLAKINTGTVGQLGLAWTYELRTGRGQQATPLVVDGAMYVTSTWSLVYALDAATGAERWVYDPKVDRAVGAKACCDVVNRGVALYEGKVFVGALDGRLIALDAGSGRLLWETVTVDQSKPYTITGAPRAANGLVYIGNGGAEYGVRGYVSAYEASTGKLAWRFYTVPGDPSKGPDNVASDPIMARAAATWNGQWWKIGGGGTVWDAIVYDPDFKQLIVGVGNGSPWNQQHRSPGGGDNLFLASMVALDAATGAYKWHYQTTPGETWDYTATQPIVLADLQIDGKARKVAMQAPKNGFFYVVDRENGRLISARPFVPMSQAKDTPAGMPISWAYDVDVATGRPVENPEARYRDKPALVRPGPSGAHNWHPMSYSPETGLVYLPAQDNALGYAHEPALDVREGFDNLGVAIDPLPDDEAVRAAIRSASKGMLLAWDPVAQRQVWRSDRTGPWNGGTLATAGGLVFQGTGDGQFLALDATTGKTLWSADNQAATLAGPISFAVGDEQYVAVTAGYGGSFFLIDSFLGPAQGNPLNGRVYAFKLGGTAPKPVLHYRRAPRPTPPRLGLKAVAYARGARLYERNCTGCHGVAALSGGVLPDLRRSVRLQDAVAFRRAVVDGELAPLGMPRFGKYVSAEDAELIRAYVARQALMAYEAEQRSETALSR